MKQVFVHCGLHKTATTYLQAMLRANAAALEPHLHVVNRVTLETREARVAACAYARGDRGVDAATVREAYAALARRAAARPDVPTLMTDEAFLGDHMGVEGETRLYPAADRIAALIVEAFAGMDARIVLYTRDPAAWLRSVHNQSVKRHRYTGALQRMVAELDEYPDWARLEARLAAAVGSERCLFLRLEDDRAHPFGAGGQLFDRIPGGAAIMAAITPRPPKNESLHPALIAVMRRVNRLPLSENAMQSVRRLAFRVQAKLAGTKP